MAASASRTDTTRFSCRTCGTTFASQSELENHNKLEHVEHKKPAGVS